jgi:cytochrome b involved in lipid metabolism
VNSGGEEVLLDVGGQDSTEAFEDVGHSDEAREILEGLLVGSLKRVVRTFPPPPLVLFFAPSSVIPASELQ